MIIISSIFRGTALAGAEGANLACGSLEVLEHQEAACPLSRRELFLRTPLSPISAWETEYQLTIENDGGRGITGARGTERKFSLSVRVLLPVLELLFRLLELSFPER